MPPKRAAKNRVCYYAPAMNVHTRQRASLEAALAGALERGELELHYQPVWQASRKRISSCEALLRWRRPGQGFAPPEEVVRLAEDTGLIVPMGRWALATAGAQARRMREAGFDVPVAVNLSRRQLIEPSLVDDVRAVLQAESLRPGALQVEISEAVLVDADTRVVAALEALDALGVALVVHNFGSGSSSLAGVQRLAVRRVKIAGELVREAPGVPASEEMVRAVLAIGRALGVQVMAEGVETERQASFLLAHGCDDMQGFFYGHPLPADEWMSYLRWACTAVVGTDGPAPASARPRSRRRDAMPKRSSRDAWRGAGGGPGRAGRGGPLQVGRGEVMASAFAVDLPSDDAPNHATRSGPVSRPGAVSWRHSPPALGVVPGDARRRPEEAVAAVCVGRS